MSTSTESAQRAAWMAAAQRGDGDAYRLLLEDVGPLVLRFVRRHVSDQAEAEDVCQETLLALHRARHAYLPGRPLEPWLLGIAAYVVRAHRRRSTRRQKRELCVETLPQGSVDEQQTGLLALGEALRALPQAQRATVEFLVGAALAPSTVAPAPTPGALRVRIHRARRALRALLLT